LPLNYLRFFACCLTHKTKQNTLYKILANTLFMGKNYIFMPECHSTNDEALKLGQNAYTPEGTLVATAHQTAGRGQRGNRWLAEPGQNITCSVLLKPVWLSISQQFFLNMAVASAIHDTIRYFVNDNVAVKWPNDIMLNQRKVCGVLIENHISGSKFSYSIVGIGLNVNQKAFEYTTATSIALETGRTFNVEEVLGKLLEHLENRYLQLKESKFDLISDEYHQNMYWRDEQHLFQKGDIPFKGIIRGVNASGQLVIQVDNVTESFGLKEVQYVL
jgi:BirA family biotin operon repressor/biotin-[acetyl-CoA-carboxylase] ligase